MNVTRLLSIYRISIICCKTLSKPVLKNNILTKQFKNYVLFYHMKYFYTPTSILHKKITRTFENNFKNADNTNDDSDEDSYYDDDHSSLLASAADIYFPEDRNLSKNYKELVVSIPTERFDVIIKAGLNISRNKTDDYFLGGKFFLNGDKVLKKSLKVGEGNCLDVLTNTSDEGQFIQRIRILKIVYSNNKKAKLKCLIRSWKAPFLRTSHNSDFN